MMVEATNQEKEWDSKSSKRSHDRRVLLQLREDLASYEWPFVDADHPVDRSDWEALLIMSLQQ